MSDVKTYHTCSKCGKQIKNEEARINDDGSVVECLNGCEFKAGDTVKVEIEYTGKIDKINNDDYYIINGDGTVGYADKEHLTLISRPKTELEKAYDICRNNPIAFCNIEKIIEREKQLWKAIEELKPS